MVIESHGLAKTYRGCEAVRDVSVRVPEGSVFALLGPNGAGKTTTLRTILNILQPDRGEIYVLGTRSTLLASRHFEHIGYASESQRLPERLDVARYLGYLRSLYSNWDVALEEALLRQFDLPSERRLKDLSHGMRMKLLLVGALAFRPKLLVLDEPLSGLDPLVRDEVVNGLLQQAQDTTILISSHELTEIESFTTHVAFMQDGRLLIQEQIETLRERFRNVNVRLAAQQSLPAPLPTGWLLPQVAGHQLQFITSDYRDDQQLHASVREHFGAVSVYAEPMNLRSIANALMQDHNRRKAQ
ncbi:ABC transporter ATP-binding protein [Steroidobacter sp. S1-65]|uniref:ABC transporter ATP-binding protein n=1 Tax=Steroidobacter gossypii TaxID=2805490 RepID=A0ABS1X227_9GAMM|nr:ABC transporter ATP-binding protein [Steroidobacter gossypii]MBM0107249.1 ABC transporter ATP-binding protein [Steroidobacter gossypii]